MLLQNKTARNIFSLRFKAILIRNFQIFSFICFFSISLNVNLVANVRVTPSSYIVSDIEVSSAKETRSVAETDLFLKAKEKAFSFIRLHLNSEDLDPTNVDIDSLMIEFIPLKTFSNGNGFTGYFEVVFDKSAIESILSLSKERKSAEQSLQFRVFLKDNISNWIKVRNFLINKDINYNVILLSNNFVQCEIKNSSIDEIKNILIDGGFELIQNNFIYFIREIKVND